MNIEKKIRQNLKELPTAKLQYGDAYFSLEEEFSSVYGSDERIGVTVVTPMQVVSHMTTTSGEMHEVIFEGIEGGIYDQAYTPYKFLDQDIRIRYVNMRNYAKTENCTIDVSIPPIINSMQKRQLELLNEKIKEYEKKANEIIYVNSWINDGTNQKLIEWQSNLDKILSLVTVNDDYEFPLQEKYTMGQPNYQNQFVKKY